jgi:hypothetical protein
VKARGEQLHKMKAVRHFLRFTPGGCLFLILPVGFSFGI